MLGGTAGGGIRGGRHDRYRRDEGHGLALAGTGLPWFGLLWLGANVLVGLNEEYLFRGYALRALWRGAGFWPAALITNAIFAGLHLSKPHENAMDIGMIFVLGLALCLSVLRTGTLWWAVGWHAAFEFGQFFLIGTHNGGQTPVGHLFEVSFPGPAWLNGGELGTESECVHGAGRDRNLRLRRMVPTRKERRSGEGKRTESRDLPQNERPGNLGGSYS
jgi:hypothetical protein